MSCNGIVISIIKEFKEETMVKKQKRAKITPETKRLIFDKALEQPRIPRNALAQSLLVEIKRQKEDEPDLTVLERMISHYRNHAEDGPQEKPWDMRTLNIYPLPPETLPAVIDAWMFIKRKRGLALSIRQAKWVSWLYPFFKKGEELITSALLQSSMELFEEMTTQSGCNWQYFNVILYEMDSGEMLPKGVAFEITREEPITGFGVEDIKKYHPHYLKKAEKQKTRKG
jgi:hypothetical protein